MKIMLVYFIPLIFNLLILALVWIFKPVAKLLKVDNRSEFDYLITISFIPIINFVMGCAMVMVGICTGIAVLINKIINNYPDHLA